MRIITVATVNGEMKVGDVAETIVVTSQVPVVDIQNTKQEAVMTRDVIVGVPGDDLSAVGHTMIQRRIRHLPVVEGGKLIGMISIGDIVKAQRDHYQGEVDTLQTIVMERGA